MVKLDTHPKLGKISLRHGHTSAHASNNSFFVEDARVHLGLKHHSVDSGNANTDKGRCFLFRTECVSPERWRLRYIRRGWNPAG